MVFNGSASEDPCAVAYCAVAAAAGSELFFALHLVQNFLNLLVRE